MTEAFISARMKAKEQIRCAWCGEWIEAGEWQVASINLNHDQGICFHPECDRAARREFRLIGQIRRFSCYNHARGKTREEMEQEVDND